jgi:hypothetical protein
MAWVKVPAEHHPIFHAALPQDPRIETLKMFGGVAAKVNGNVFAGLFGRSTMIWLPEPERARALALKGAAPFDPMGNGQARSDKIMLPESMMNKPAELRRWLTRQSEQARGKESHQEGQEDDEQETLNQTCRVGTVRVCGRFFRCSSSSGAWGALFVDRALRPMPRALRLPTPRRTCPLSYLQRP